MTVEIRTATAGAGAAAVLARATTIVLDGETRTDLDDLLPNGRLDSPAGPLAAVDVADGAGALVAKLILDVETVLSINRAETLARLGLWVADRESGP